MVKYTQKLKNEKTHTKTKNENSQKQKNEKHTKKENPLFLSTLEILFTFFRESRFGHSAETLSYLSHIVPVIHRRYLNP